MLFYRLFLALSIIGTVTSRPDFPHDQAQYRDLKAAKTRAHLLGRSDDIVIKREIELTYAEDYGHNDDGTTFASRVRLSGDKPALLLEEFEHLLNRVECSRSSMTLGFREDSSFSKAKEACTTLGKGLVVASHSSCSEAGAHSVFKTLGYLYDTEGKTITFEIENTTWSDAFPHRRMDFGLSPDPHYLHRHDRLSRRQNDVQPSTSKTVVIAATSLIPSTAPTNTLVAIDLSSEQIDTTFSFLDVPSAPITVGCKKCTSKGELKLTQGAFEFSDFDDFVEGVTNNLTLDIFKSGFLKLELTGFETSILLSAIPSGSMSFAYDLFSFPVAGFKVPGFGRAGIAFQPQLAFDIGLKGAVELTWGFEVKVPDESYIYIDFDNFHNSNVTGFDKTTFKTLPFNTNASDIELTLAVAFRPFVPIGVDLDTTLFDLTFQAGPYIDLPYINTTITQLATTAVDENCESKGQSSDNFKAAFKNLTHIAVDWGMGAGLQFEAKIDALGYDINPVETVYDFPRTAWPVATTCMAYGPTGLVEAKQAAASITAAAEADVKANKDGDTPSSGSPFFVGSLGQLAILGLCAVTAIFAVM